MKKKTVGIVADYNASEQTFCALYLAGYLERIHRYVLYLTPEPPDKAHVQGFSHQWDARIKSISEECDAKKYLGRCDNVFWFHQIPSYQKFIRPGTVTACVANPYYWTKEQYQLCRTSTYTLVTAKSLLPAIQHAQYLPNCVYWSFDPLFQSIHNGAVGLKNVLIPAFGFTPEQFNFSHSVQSVIRACLPDWRVLLGTYDAKTESSADLVTDMDDWRIKNYLKHTSCIVDLNYNPIWNLYSSLAGCFCIPWMGYDLPPHNDIENQSQRRLITCDTRQTSRFASVAVYNAEQTALQIVRFLQELGQFHTQPIGMFEQRRDAFLDITNKIVKTNFKIGEHE